MLTHNQTHSGIGYFAGLDGVRALAIVAVITTGVLEIIVLAPLGAAILTGLLLLTSTAIVRHLLLIGQ